jgi:hypothetical protein
VLRAVAEASSAGAVTRLGSTAACAAALCTHAAANNAAVISAASVAISDPDRGLVLLFIPLLLVLTLLASNLHPHYLPRK